VRYCSPFAVATQSLNVTWNSRRETIDYDFSTIAANISYIDLIEPLSLDEAYLDVTENKTGLPTATLVARTIREQIRQELNLTASAGVAPNKFFGQACV